MPRRRRDLDPEEQALWQSVARTVTPIAGRPVTPEIGPVEPPAPAPPSPGTARFAPFRLGEKPAPVVAPSPAPSLRMDAKTHARMTRGKLAPEARIDLHGMTVAEAHGELIHFVLNAQQQGFRLVLVITGKGRPPRDDDHLPRQAGVLRHQVPHWLHLPPLGPAVQQVSQAHLRHGGAGAYYVYLRRRHRPTAG